MTDNELSAAVAERVMGHTFWLEQRGKFRLAVWCKKGNPWDSTRDKSARDRYERCDSKTAVSTGFFGLHPDFAADWTAAAQVIGAMGRRGWEMECTIFADDGTASVVFHRGEPQDYPNPAVRESDSFPRAVCEAAVAALEVSHD